MATAQLRVLLVEDDESVRESLAAYLRQCGMAVAVADSLAAVDPWLDGASRLDVALVDNLLPQRPGMPPARLGVQLVTDLRGRFPEVECILFTGGDMESGLAALHAGAYRYLAKPLQPEEIALHIRSAAEQARLRRERDLLSTILAINNELTSHLNTDSTLQTIVDAVPRLVGADIATVVLENPETGKIDRFHSTPHGDELSWRAHLRGRRLTRHIMRSGEAYGVEEVAARDDIDESLRHAGIRSFIGVPIRGEQHHLGVLYSYSLRPYAFPAQAEQVLLLLAGQAAIALRNAQLYERSARERERAERLASQLLSLHAIAREMQSELSPDRLLDKIAAAAVKLVQADSGCILLLDGQRQVLSMRAACGLGDKVKAETQVAVGCSIAGRVVQLGAPLIVNDVPHDARFDNPAAADEHFWAIISTPLFVNGECIGTLDVHSKERGRRFGEDELQILTRMADQAAIALSKARYIDEIKTGLRTLRLMYEASQPIIAAHEQKTVMQRVVQAAVRVLDGWRAIVVLIGADGAPQELAQVGFEAGMDHSGQIRPDGVSIQVARSGKPWFIEDIVTVNRKTNHLNQISINPALLADQVRGAACVPLAMHGRTVGVLWVHFRKPHRFLETEREALRLFASQAGVALTNARLVADLQQQTEHFLRLFHSAPTGIISVDSAGNISSANDRTGEILKMPAESLHGQPVSSVYFAPATSRQVGRLLYDTPGGRIANVETQLRDANGEAVPIRLAAALLYAADGKPNGSVGYFEDLRSLRDTENRLKVLLAASNIVAQAERLDSGLHDLARMVVNLLDATFCRILLLDESKEVLATEAAYIHPKDDLGGWQPHLAERLDSTEWGRRAEFLEAPGPVLCRWDEEHRREFLAAVSHQLGLQAELQSLLLIPLRTSHGVVGLLGVGTLQPWTSAPFSPEQQELTLAIANQTASLIERMWLYERNQTARERLRLFYEA
ncbi:MAG TPA: GAF domain-containing protein, partial [Caldilineaceae bacterium]|nr:GAF domain-containing protein [Caldilineaceae bacterium]